MQRVLIGTAAILLAAGTGLVVGVAAKPNPPAANPVLAYLKPVPMDTAGSSAVGPIAIDVPINGTIYPPDIIPPQFAWRDNNSAVTIWRIEVIFGEKARSIQVWSAGEKMQIGPVDEALTGYVPPTLTPEQAADHTWRPDPKTWEEIKKHSVGQLAKVVITGFESKPAREPLSRAEATISTSKDPVGAPIFYRDVPLIPPNPDTEQRGVIKPLPDSVLPKIKWQLRYINQTESKVMMTDLPTCGNCHSFSRDGKTMGIDVDGPANDKGLYALVPIKKVSTISNDYLLRWSSFSEEHSQKRFGFMSQVSPDGKFVVNSIDVPHAHGTRVLDRLYNGFYENYGFGQVFYPTRGVLAWYSKETGKLQPLPGADDPNYVQTSAFWSPDGKYLIYSRAAARDPYPPGYKRSMYANDPNETQVQYDLYKIPFNDGKGGTAERIVGASENGMSNNFPKVSPDGKWIIFVQCKNGLLMRPDSKLYIVPFEGGEARPLESNLPVMNSWHTFNPNGRWLAFSSKSPSLYTHLYLTHIDDQGHASPPVVVENATASNRAVNIPEFVNLGPEGLDHIDTPAIDFYREFDVAQQLQDAHKYSDAVPAWKVAADKDPTDARPWNNMGVALAASGKTSDAITAYDKSLAMNSELPRPPRKSSSLFRPVRATITVSGNKRLRGAPGTRATNTASVSTLLNSARRTGCGERDKVGEATRPASRSQCPAEAGVPAVKVASELVVEDAGADLEQEVGAAGSVPTGQRADCRAFSPTLAPPGTGRRPPASRVSGPPPSAPPGEVNNPSRSKALETAVPSRCGATPGNRPAGPSMSRTRSPAMALARIP